MRIAPTAFAAAERRPHQPFFGRHSGFLFGTVLRFAAAPVRHGSADHDSLISGLTVANVPLTGLCLAASQPTAGSRSGRLLFEPRSDLLHPDGCMGSQPRVAEVHSLAPGLGYGLQKPHGHVAPLPCGRSAAHHHAPRR
jgi:hypothetical protein